MDEIKFEFQPGDIVRFIGGRRSEGPFIVKKNVLWKRTALCALITHLDGSRIPGFPEDNVWNEAHLKLDEFLTQVHKNKTKKEDANK